MTNRFYRNISAALSGTQEYMAAEKLYELHDDARFDLVVVDTPPTRNALDFLEAPARLDPLPRPPRLPRPDRPHQGGLQGGQRRRPGLPAHAQPRGRRGGDHRRHHLLPGLRRHGGRLPGPGRVSVDGLLTSGDTAYVLVTSPRRDTIEEARFFARRLAERRSPPAAVIVNRLHPRFPTKPAKRPSAARAELQANADRAQRRGRRGGGGPRSAPGSIWAGRRARPSRCCRRTSTISTGSP